MNLSRQLTFGLAGLGLAFTHCGVALAQSDFRILTPEEVASHGAAMASLQGLAREDYRNAQYEQLKQRAQAQGYRLPASPPWATAKSTAASSSGTSEAPTVATAETETASAVSAAEPTALIDDAAARHAAMREKMAAQREAIQRELEERQQAASDTAEAPIPPKAPEPPAQIATVQPSVAPTPPTPPVAPTPPTQQQNATASISAIDGAEAKPQAIEKVHAASETPALVKPRDATADQADPDSGPAKAVASSDASSYANSAAMSDYRAKMRERFDTYMKERQAQVAAAAKKQREQHEASIEKNRAARPSYTPYPGYGYPQGPVYGPRYPAAYPGYRAPYWQQPR